MPCDRMRTLLVLEDAISENIRTLPPWGSLAQLGNEILKEHNRSSSSRSGGFREIGLWGCRSCRWSQPYWYRCTHAADKPRVRPRDQAQAVSHLVLDVTHDAMQSIVDTSALRPGLVAWSSRGKFDHDGVEGLIPCAGVARGWFGMFVPSHMPQLGQR